MKEIYDKLDIENSELKELLHKLEMLEKEMKENDSIKLLEGYTDIRKVRGISLLYDYFLCTNA
jgi:hypothetical protein